FPVTKNMKAFELLVTTEKDTILEIELWDTGKPQNYVPMHLLEKKQVEVGPGENQWINPEFSFEHTFDNNIFVIIKKNEGVSLHLSQQSVSGVLSFIHQEV